MELRCAIKLETNNSKYYALLGVVHLQQGFPGMAKVYIRQALKLDPQQPLAIEYAAKLNLGIKADPKSMAKAISIAALLSNFLSGKRS
jgi:Flp pilus assembly protein TadD